MMKKLVCMLLALCMLLSGLAFAEENKQPPVYESNFTESKDGWTGRSRGGMKLGRLDGALTVSFRVGDWNGPVHEVALEAGTRYWLCVDVMNTSNSSANFVLALVDGQDEEARTVELARAMGCERGSWVTLTGSYTCEQSGTLLMSVQTDGSPMANFNIKNAAVLLHDPSQVTAVTWEGELPCLKDVYAGHFDIGTCMSANDARNAARCELIRTQYNIVTPENELKPDAVLDIPASKALAKEDDTAVAVHFNSAKPIMDFCWENGLKMHGHVFVWHSQTPEAFFHEGYDTGRPYVSREVMLARLDNFIRLTFEYVEENYPGMFVSWDVVNEAVADGSVNLRSSNWTKVVGQDFISRAFEIADKYAPEGLVLCYNDYSTPYEPKLTGIVNLLETLVSEGHIDGYGFQTHYSWNDPSVDAVRKAFDRVSALGLQLRVSEMDIKVSKDTDAARAQQAEKYAELMKLYLSYPMKAVQVWGVCDATSWIGSSYPLPFDARLQPKPAFFAMTDAVNGAEAE